jgi:hypothetical protein
MTTNVSDIYRGNYVTKDDLGDRSHRAIVQQVASETVGFGATAQLKIVLRLTTPKGAPWSRPVALNATSARLLRNAFGNDAGGWVGCEVTVKKGMLRFGSGSVEGVLVEPSTPAVTAAPAAARSPQPIVQPAPPSASPVIPDDGVGAEIDDEIPF